MFGAAMILGLVLAGAILLGLLWAVASYNGLVAARMEYQEAFALVLQQQRQRAQLLPALLETARGHMRHERETLEALNVAVREAVAVFEGLDARTVGESEMQKLQQVDAGVHGAVGRLMNLASVYPELRASPNMARLSEELSFADNQVSAAKQAYDEQVARYNALRSAPPQALISSLFGFGDVPVFGMNEEQVSLTQTPRMGPLKA